MSLETNIENNFAAYLSDFTGGVPVIPAAGLDRKDDLETLAQRNPGGAIFISYSGMNYQKAGASRLFRGQKEFAALIISKSREDRQGIYDILQTIREKAYEYSYNGLHLNPKSETVDAEPIRMGLFKAKLIFESDTVYPA